MNINLQNTTEYCRVADQQYEKKTFCNFSYSFDSLLKSKASALMKF